MRGENVNIHSLVELTYFPEENTQHFHLSKHQGSKALTIVWCVIRPPFTSGERDKRKLRGHGDPSSKEQANSGKSSFSKAPLFNNMKNRLAYVNLIRW